ncbi:MAG TPA: FAD-dependent monooxygenase, partial [Candidatus Acidoferrales bacterium]|nr:FAD-dependent monooxygenase [Candidatus Acidoferrales bacterium]
MHVLIIGAGPTGAALSFLLARRGVDVELLEREERLDRIFRGEALMPGGVEAIEQMGLAENFNLLPRRTIECAELFIGGTRIIRADWPEVAGKNAAQVVSQPALIEMFIDAARQYSNFKLRMGATIRDVRVTDRSVEAEVQSDNGPSVVRGDVIVGADGRGSLVRSRLGLKLERSPFPF